jgi:hypothetical protein
MKFLLSVIALCLVMIAAKLYIPEAHAEVLTGYETSLVLDQVEGRCRVDHTAIRKMIDDRSNYSSYYDLPIRCR